MKQLVVLLFVFLALALSFAAVSADIRLEIIDGNAQSSPVSTDLPKALSVKLTINNVVQDNETIVWTDITPAKETGVKVGFRGQNKTVTNNVGIANITAALGFTPGNAVVMASSLKYPSASVQFTITVQSKFNIWGWVYLGIVLIGAVVMLLSCVLLAVWILLQNSGTDKMKEISNPIKEGAEGFFKVQYLAITALAVPTFVIVFLLYVLRQSSPSDPKINRFIMALITSFSFLIGALFSGLAGLTGMWVAVRANIRVASAARKSYNGPIAIALRSGAFSGFLVVALSVLGVCSLFSILYLVLPPDVAQAQQISMLLVGYGFGASFVALFAQLGGGIYTKAADVGADIIGKVESNIPEDDVRNPAVVADLVGDNVGDCAGRGADLFESIAAENIGAMILAGTLAANASPQIENPVAYIVFPLMIHIFGLLSSWVGMLCVRVREPKRSATPAIQATTSETSGEDQEPLIQDAESGASINAPKMKGSDLADPMKALNIGYTITVIIATAFFLAITFFLLNSSRYPNAWWHFAICGVLGIVVSWVFVFITIYYTDFNWWPVRNIAQASTTGAGTNVIAGVAVGMESTAAPVLTIAIAIISAYWIGRTSGIEDVNGIPIGGLFGTAVATMGMLASAGFILAMDCFGPITDNAGGIAEMAQLPHDVRVITDRLDAVGNTTKALTKGYAIGSASLAAFLLFSAFLDEISSYANMDLHVVDLAIPEVWVGGLLGAMLVYLFCSLAIRAVGKSAETVIHEVRRQFRERPGIMNFTQKPDYARCVAMVSRSALIQMILPGLLPVLSPIVIGLFFRLLGWITGRPNLGAQVGAGFLMIATIAGILAALFLNNAGGAWDNAKKYIEMGVHGGKGSDTHKAAVTGDTVGDPFKDTAGPSVHVLIKLLSTISLVLAPLLVGSVQQ